MTKYDAALRDI